MSKDITLKDLSEQINQVNDGVIELAQMSKEQFDSLNVNVRDVQTRLGRVEEQILEPIK